jgi:hypothetical protein
MEAAEAKNNEHSSTIVNAVKSMADKMEHTMEQILHLSRADSERKAMSKLDDLHKYRTIKGGAVPEYNIAALETVPHYFGRGGGGERDVRVPTIYDSRESGHA